MSAPLPGALRTRFCSYIREGLSGREAARRVKLSAATGTRWARQVRMQGHVEAGPQGRPPGSGKLAPHWAFIEEVIAQDPDITLHELRDALADAEGLQVHHASIARLGFTYEKSRRLPPSAAAPGGNGSGPTGLPTGCPPSPRGLAGWCFSMKLR